MRELARVPDVTVYGKVAAILGMLVEIAGDKLYFQTISRTGQTVDSGVLQRQPKPPAANTAATQ